MRILRVALLAGIPVVGLAAGPLLDRIGSPREPVTATMTGPAMAISGNPARAAALAAALDGLSGRVTLQAVRCAEALEAEAGSAHRGVRVYRPNNPEHVAASEVSQRESALLASLEDEAAVVSAEIAGLSAQHASETERLAGLTRQEAAVQADWAHASAATVEAADRVTRSMAAADQLDRRAASRDGLYREIADLQARLPRLQAAADGARVVAEAVDLDDIQQESARATGLVEAKQRGVQAARQQLKRSRQGGDVESARAALREAQAQRSRAEDRLSISLAAVISAQKDLARMEAARRDLLHASTALRSAQDELSAAPGHCAILSAEADKLPRLERKHSHRAAEEQSARVALDRVAALSRQQSEVQTASVEALRAQEHALAALTAGIAAQAQQVSLSVETLSSIPARLPRTPRGDEGALIETWTRTCEVSAHVQWTDAAGVPQQEHLTQRAVIADVGSPEGQEAAHGVGQGAYPLDDDALTRQADRALADDIRMLVADDVLASHTMR
ncbi:MAG: hypothetical protein P8R54_04075 [Myxococcota bacterium]|nr:hypothetical protein [Myxococcota bacterium]